MLSSLSLSCLIVAPLNASVLVSSLHQAQITILSLPQSNTQTLMNDQLLRVRAAYSF